jgi:hypothetical protein
MKSAAKTPQAYIAALPAERRDALNAVRDVILEKLPEGYVEAMDWGMISYQVPLATYPDTYNERPLMYAALASQKGYMVVYLSAIYADPISREAFEKAYRATGKRYDVGQSCVRFRKLDDLPLEVIGEAVASTPLWTYLDRYEASRHAASSQRAKSAAKSSASGRAKSGLKSAARSAEKPTKKSATKAPKTKAPKKRR